MKIINRKDFLALPANTLFAKYANCNFEDIQIKGDTLGNDFQSQSLITVESTGSLLKSEETGESFSLDLEGMGRDREFEDTQLFAVYEELDLQGLALKLLSLSPNLVLNLIVRNLHKPEVAIEVNVLNQKTEHWVTLGYEPDLPPGVLDTWILQGREDTVKRRGYTPYIYHVDEYPFLPQVASQSATEGIQETPNYLSVIADISIVLNSVPVRYEDQVAVWTGIPVVEYNIKTNSLYLGSAANHPKIDLFTVLAGRYGIALLDTDWKTEYSREFGRVYGYQALVKEIFVGTTSTGTYRIRKEGFPNTFDDEYSRENIESMTQILRTSSSKE